MTTILLFILKYSLNVWSQNIAFQFQAYQKIPNLLHCNCLRRIRGDNYCGVRGTLFQCLSNGIKLKHWSNLTHTLDLLNQAYQDKTSGLKSWTFANRLPNDAESLFSRMSECVSTLLSTVSID